MNVRLYYLFDPLCGWCYGAMPALSDVGDAPGINVELFPTGIFSGAGARSMSAAFSTFAWDNDQRVAQLSGQVFTERYRQAVLGDHQQRFDSGPATLALTAVSLTRPADELVALKAIQHARFVEGQDITNPQILAAILASLSLDQAAGMMLHPDSIFREANQLRIDRAQVLMAQFNARGVPTLIGESQTRRWMLDTSAAYSFGANAFITQLQRA